MKFLRDLKEGDIAGKTAILRLDLNVEPDELKSGHNWKTDSVKPTIDWLLEKRARNIIILSHRGRPIASQERMAKSKFSLKFLVPVLKGLIGQKIIFWPSYDFEKLKKEVAIRPGIYLVENLRFLSGEEKNDSKLAKQLAGLGDFYINDAFAVSHRANASVAAITGFIPSYAGLLFQNEIKNLRPILFRPKKPLIIVLGGAKIRDKIGLIENLGKKADYFLVGGAIANTFLAAKNLPVGDSLIDEKGIDFAGRFINDKRIILPSDLKISGRQILDIGPETLKNYAGFLRKAGTIIWNGPMGCVEDKGFEDGTVGIWRIISGLKNAEVIVGGGDTIASLQLMTDNKKLLLSVKSSKVFVSTGGGAMLEYLSGNNLPGIKSLG